MKFLVLCAAVAAVAADIRVEYQLVDYNNPGSVLADGKSKCERSAPCDPKLTGYVDTEKSALNAWPGPKKVSDFTEIFKQKATDRTKVGKVVSRDICGDDFRKTNLRVEAVDQNTLSSNKEIQQFECLTSSSSRDVARDEKSARWSDPKQCQQKFTKPGNAQLTYQWRAFNTKSNECSRNSGSGSRNTGSGSGNSGNFDSGRNTGSGSGNFDSGRNSGSGSRDNFGGSGSSGNRNSDFDSGRNSGSGNRDNFGSSGSSGNRNSDFDSSRNIGSGSRDSFSGGRNSDSRNNERF